MAEVFFVLKSFIVAMALIICMQVKIGHSSIETHFIDWVETSAVPVYLQGVATGAVVAARNASRAASDFLGKTFGYGAAGSGSLSASRINFDFKRSPQVSSSATSAASTASSSVAPISAGATVGKALSSANANSAKAVEAAVSSHEDDAP